ncbi:hypothetical protein [Companilactobacillus sp. HBUAS56275]|uniref:Uncharacterized protein n=1 Tax=Candidatus Companilactobacillus pullicola TaxID=2838523 RepID=A0A9D1ZNT9_9LACO|nr:hypothetical protein [Candidatus Companilactobacillus pullicola]
MLKFGKKLTYRPLLISLFWATLIGGLFGLNISRILGLRIAFIIFLLIFIGHYFTILPIIFSYWDSTDQFIRYSDKSNYFKRLIIMIFPHTEKLKIIAKKDVKTIQITGLPIKKLISSTLLLSSERGLLYNLMSMLRNPVKLKLILNNGTIITLNLSRDFARHPTQTAGRLRIFLRDFHENQIDLTPATRHLIY